MTNCVDDLLNKKKKNQFSFKNERNGKTNKEKIVDYEIHWKERGLKKRKTNKVIILTNQLNKLHIYQIYQNEMIK